MRVGPYSSTLQAFLFSRCANRYRSPSCRCISASKRCLTESECAKHFHFQTFTPMPTVRGKPTRKICKQGAVQPENVGAAAAVGSSPPNLGDLVSAETTGSDPGQHRPHPSLHWVAVVEAVEGMPGRLARCALGLRNVSVFHCDVW